MEASIIPSRGQEDLKSSQIEMQHFWQFKLLPSNWRGNKWHIQVDRYPVLIQHQTCCSVTQLCQTLCDPMNCGTPASLSFTIFWSLLKLMSIGSVMPSNHLIFCHLPLFMPSIFPSIRVFSSELTLRISGGSIRASASASVLPMNIQDWSPLGWTGWISLQSKGLSRLFSNTTVWKHQLFSAQPSLWSNSHICIWLLEKPELWLYRPLLAKWCLGWSQLFFQGVSVF